MNSNISPMKYMNGFTCNDLSTDKTVDLIAVNHVKRLSNQYYTDNCNNGIRSTNHQSTVDTNGCINVSATKQLSSPGCETVSMFDDKQQNGKCYRLKESELYEEPPYHIKLLCYLSYAVLMLFGYIRDFMRKTGLEKNLAAVERNRDVCHWMDLFVCLWA